MADGANSTRRVLDGYTLPLLDQLITIVSATTIVAYSLYTFSAVNLPENHVMMLTIPFVIYGIFRYLYLIQVKHSGGAPEELLALRSPSAGIDRSLGDIGTVDILFFVAQSMPAISATAPGKIILLGEHAVVYGQPAIAVPVNQVKAKVIVIANPISSPGKIHVQAPAIELGFQPG